MKTFDEAIKVVCIGDSRDAMKCAQVVDQQIKSMSIIKEVCMSREAKFVAEALLSQLSDESKEGAIVCLLNAMAQGVLIGIEMEKQVACN